MGMLTSPQLSTHLRHPASHPTSPQILTSVRTDNTDQSHTLHSAHSSLLCVRSAIENPFGPRFSRERACSNMRVLQQLVKQQGELVQLAARAFGTSGASAADVAVASSSSPFLRYSNPYPQALDHTPLLSTIPETQVRSNLSCRHESGGNDQSLGAVGQVLARQAAGFFTSREKGDGPAEQQRDQMRGRGAVARIRVSL